MFKLNASLKAWKTDNFTPTFKQEVGALAHKHLPLQKGLSLSSYVSDEPISAIVNNSSETHTHINIKTRIFYTGIIAGCSCADDPTPLDTQNECCELRFYIDKQSAETTVSLINE
ncbi:hypothetical protein MNBD_GAMMA08-97 [hydrothermal vent metagenome]|uniref:Uncharacterized protein n=1 Tax=hydrothermal vent metagenome TaxID=652676 RepID=A0A3B0XUK7_9ZZZZ